MGFFDSGCHNISFIGGVSRENTCCCLLSVVADKTVTWGVGSPAAVSVDQDGTIHALDLGGAIIKVKTTDGNLEAACMVTVQNK